MKTRLIPGFLLLTLLLSSGCGGNDNPPVDVRANADEQFSSTLDARQEVSPNRNVLMLGNSLTAGYGLESHQAYPAYVQQKIDSAGWDFSVINAGVSGETSAGGLSRIDWLLNQPVAVLVLALGANDGLRGIHPEVTERNLQGIIDHTKDRYPDVRILIAGMQIPPNLGEAYAAQFRDIFPSLAEANDAELIPFLLEDVAGIRELNLPDGIHPTPEGQRILARNVWEVLEGVLADI